MKDKKDDNDNNEFSQKKLMKCVSVREYECTDCGFISVIGGTCPHCDLKD
jgi:hypothetical protein